MKNSRKMFLSMFLIFSMILTACSQVQETTEDENEPDSATNSEEVELRIVTMFGGTDPVTGVLADIITEYEDQNPGITIVNDSMTAGDAFNTKVSTDFSSGNEPDVLFYFTGANASSFVDAGMVVPLDDVLASDEAWNGDFVEAALEQMKEKDGNLYAIPVTGFYEGLIVNTELFENNGIELPTDWAKYEAAITSFKEKGITPISQSLPESWYLIEHYLMAAGGPEGHQAPFDTTWAEGLNAIKTHADLEAFPVDANTLDDAMSQNLFATEQAAMMINGSWAVGGLSEEMQEKTQVLTMPAMPGSSGTGTDVIGGFSTGFYLTKKSHDSDRKDAAIDFIKFLTSKENILKYATANGGIPAAKVTVEGLSPAAASGHAMMANASSYSMPADSIINGDSFTFIRTNVPQIAAGEKTAEQVLEEAEALNK